MPEPYARFSTAGANGLGVGPEIFRAGLMVSVADGLVAVPAGVEALAVSDAVIVRLGEPDPVTSELEH